MWDSATISCVLLDLAFPVLEGSSMHHKILTRGNYQGKRMTLVCRLPGSCMNTRKYCTVNEQHCQAEQRPALL